MIKLKTIVGIGVLAMFVFSSCKGGATPSNNLDASKNGGQATQNNQGGNNNGDNGTGGGGQFGRGRW